MFAYASGVIFLEVPAFVHIASSTPLCTSKAIGTLHEGSCSVACLHVFGLHEPAALAAHVAAGCMPVVLNMSHLVCACVWGGGGGEGGVAACKDSGKIQSRFSPAPTVPPLSCFPCLGQSEPISEDLQYTGQRFGVLAWRMWLLL